MIDLIPTRIAEIEMELIEGEVLLYDPRQTRAVYLNPTAALVFGLCDGTRSVREVIGMIAECYTEASSNNLTEEVLVTLNELQQNGILTIK